MQVAYFEKGEITLKERPMPEPKAGWALLEVRMAGICNTDVELQAGYYGFSGIPGHELVAKVIRAGASDDAPHLLGKRVVVDINYACGQCSFCARDQQRHCPTRTVLGIVNQDGCFAEYCLAPVANLVELPESLPDEEAVFAEPLAAALEIGQQVHLTGKTRLLVVGDGKLGLLIALGLRFACPSLILAGRHEDKLAIASLAGVATAKVPAQGGIPTLSKELGRFDVVVEASGKAQTIQQVLDLVRPEGTIVAKTTSHDTSSIDMARVVVDEINIVGSRCGDIALAVPYLANRWVDVRPLIENIYPFSAFTTAFEHALRPGAKKILLDFK